MGPRQQVPDDDTLLGTPVHLLQMIAISFSSRVIRIILEASKSSRHVFPTPLAPSLRASLTELRL